MAKKYFDAEKLIAEIKRRKAEAELARLEAEGVSSLTYNMRLAEENLCMFLLSFIDSLQQEQPETDEDDGKFVKISVRKEFADELKKLGNDVQKEQMCLMEFFNTRKEGEK